MNFWRHAEGVALCTKQHELGCADFCSLLRLWTRWGIGRLVSLGQIDMVGPPPPGGGKGWLGAQLVPAVQSWWHFLCSPFN